LVTLIPSILAHVVFATVAFLVYRLGTIMRPNMAQKKTTVCNMRPFGVAAPIGCEISTKEPNSDCVSLYVSGLATMKNTRAEMKEYLAFRLIMFLYHCEVIFDVHIQVLEGFGVRKAAKRMGVESGVRFQDCVNIGCKVVKLVRMVE
jgi:hypothetical protein